MASTFPPSLDSDSTANYTIKAKEVLFDNVTFMRNISSQYDTDDEMYKPYYLRPETYIVPVLFALIFIIGAIGNGTLVFIFIKHKAIRNVPNTYILSLALADLLVLLTTVPFTSIIYTLESWPWGEIVCRLSELGKDISIGVSVFNLTALSADRYLAIVDPLRMLYATGGSRRSTRITIATATIIWLLAILLALPAYINSHILEFKTDQITFCICYPFPSDKGKDYIKAIVLIRFFVYYSLPLSIVAIFYALIARHLILSAKNVPGELQGTQRQMVARRKVAVTVLAFVLVFAICFLPKHVFILWFNYNPTANEDYDDFWHALKIIGFCLSFLNCCVNPIALYITSGIFRKYFNRYLLCRKTVRDPHSSFSANVSNRVNTQRNSIYNKTQVSYAVADSTVLIGNQ